jgi:hypothetical protein
MGIGLELIGAVLVFVLSWWIGWRLYLRFWLKGRGWVRRCVHCGRYIRGDPTPTYCPACGELLVRGSKRR